MLSTIPRTVSHLSPSVNWGEVNYYLHRNAVQRGLMLLGEGERASTLLRCLEHVPEEWLRSALMRTAVHELGEMGYQSATKTDESTSSKKEQSPWSLGTPTEIDWILRDDYLLSHSRLPPPTVGTTSPEGITATLFYHTLRIQDLSHPLQLELDYLRTRLPDTYLQSENYMECQWKNTVIRLIPDWRETLLPSTEKGVRGKVRPIVLQHLGELGLTLSDLDLSHGWIEIGGERLSLCVD